MPDRPSARALADGELVVRTADLWGLAPANGRHTVPVSTRDLLGRLGPDLAPSDDPLEPTWPPLPPATRLGPRTAVVAQVRGGLLEIEALDGRRHRLGAPDICLLAAIDGPIRADEVLARAAAELGDGTSRDDLAARLAALVATGRVAHLGVADDEPPPAASGTAEEPTPEADDTSPGRLSRGARRLRSRLTGRGRSPAPPADATVVPPDTGTGTGTDTDTDTDADADDATAIQYLDDPFPGGARGEVPVYAVWPTRTGPVVALGLLTAAARHHRDGLLATWYEIRRPEDPPSFEADLAERDGPVVVLLSNYVWSLEENLDIARRAKAACPDAVIVHGGPSTPKYDGDLETFFAEHGELVDVAVHGEGEDTLVALLEALGPTFPAADLTRLVTVDGLSFRHPDTGEVVRTPDRDRIADLDRLPSPYLTGEFDHLPVSAWDVPSGLLGLVLESNRGCPYGCTFCDWGSSTMSRIRKFGLDRVRAEMRWAAERGHGAWMIADANFGIISRDVEIAEHIAAMKAEYGHPTHFGFNVAKNTTKHLTDLLDRLVSAGVTPHFSLALQTRDEATLAAVERTNISTDHYLALAAAFRRRVLPLEADIMVGLPGQTVESFADDLQFLVDHDVPARMWITEVLPNAPMNDPEYRERWSINADDTLVLLSSSTFTAEDRATMMRLRHAYTVFERFGLLRQVTRYAQWDHGVSVMTVLGRIVERSEHQPDRYPLLNWLMRYFDFFNVPPLGWQAFAAEVGDFLSTEFGIGPSPDRETVLAAQVFLLPDSDRRLPATLALDHDLVAYVRDHNRRLWGDGVERPVRPLREYGPGELPVWGDPLDRCGRGQALNGDPRNEVLTESFWLVGHWELDSPLTVAYSEVAGTGTFRGPTDAVPDDLGEMATTPEPSRPEPVSVSVGRPDRDLIV